MLASFIPPQVIRRAIVSGVLITLSATPGITQDAAPSAVEAITKPAVADTPPAPVDPATAPAASTPPAPAMPDPLVAPLEDPPVATDLIAGDAAAPTPTESVVVNLINRLVERGVLTQGDAAELVSQARQDAAVASQNASAAALVAADAAMASEEDIVVTHIPEPVKERLREEIREEIMAQLPPSGFVIEGDPGDKEAVVGELEEAPGWAKKIELFGDLRIRYDATRFADGNDNSGSFPDFNRINNGAPFDVAGFEFSPQLNVDEDRRRFRVRARAGLHADIGDGFMVGLRAATGNDNSPVSTNQTLGGNFNKYALWLDRAFLRWDGAIGSTASTFSAGRFENPFYRTSDIMWDNDMAFDGVAFTASPEFGEKVGGFLTVGAFPLFNSGFNFPNNDPDKFDSSNRYLYGTQGGIDFPLGSRTEAKFAVGYHDFDDVEGELSEPFLPLSANDAGSTDERRPPFAQKGNTYMPLRRIIADPLNNFGTTNQYQYFGLASEFQILSYNARIDLNQWEPYQISLLGEFATNLGFDKEAIEQVAVNNRGPVPAGGGVGRFEGGNVAWNAGVQFGKPVFEKAWDWNAMLGYRFIESDAVLDAFNDSDFGLGGTNVEGFTVGTGVAISKKVNVNLRWFSASEIAGPPLKNDIFMFDLNAKF